MKKLSAVFAIALFSFLVIGSSTNSINESSVSNDAKFSCPYLNKIHSNSNVSDVDKANSCPYLKSEEAKSKIQNVCPYQEKQKQIYYEMNKKRAAEKIKLS